MKMKFMAFFLVMFMVNCETNSQTKEDDVFGSIDTLVHFDAVPSDPVFDLLELNTSKAELPGTVSKFFASIMNASDLKGNLTSGFAASFAPYQIIGGNKLLLRDYINKWWTRFASNIQISVGTAPSRNADSSLNWGAGVKFVFWNSGDKRLDTKAIQRAIDAEKNALLGAYSELLKHANTPEEAEEYIQYIIKHPDEYEKFKSDSIKNNKDSIEAQELMSKQKSVNTPDWNSKYALDLSIGTVYRAGNSNILDSRFTKIRAWLNGGIGFSDFQLIGQLGILYQLKDKGQTKDSLFSTTSLNVRYGSSDFRAGLGIYALKFDKGTISVAGEIRLSTIGWLTFSVDRNLIKDQTSTWSQSFGIKTTIGTFKF